MDRATAERVAGSPRVSRMALRASHAERLSEGTVLLSRSRRGQALVTRSAILAIRLEGCLERRSDAVHVHHEVATRHGVERRARYEVGAAFVGAAPDEVPARGRPASSTPAGGPRRFIACAPGIAGRMPAG